MTESGTNDREGRKGAGLAAGAACGPAALGIAHVPEGRTHLPHADRAGEPGARLLPTGRARAWAHGGAGGCCSSTSPRRARPPRIVERIFETTGRIRRERRLNILLVEQRVVEALELCVRGYVLETGRVALEGTHTARPADPRVPRAYLGA